MPVQVQWVDVVAGIAKFEPVAATSCTVYIGFMVCHMHADPALAGMGTTIAGLVLDANGARWFNVGDSRVYRVRDDGSLEQVSVDDRIAPDLADALGLIPNTLAGFRPHVGTVSPPQAVTMAVVQ